MTDGRAHGSGGRRGFTLIESMATIIVLATLGSVASLIIYSAVDGYSEATTSAQLHAEASIALDLATRELRRIPRDEAASQMAPMVTSTNPSWIIWEHTAGGPRYEIIRQGSVVQFESNGTGLADLMSDVTSFTVSTYDKDDNLLPSILVPPGTEDIRRVQLEVTVTRNGVSESLRTKVYIRSMQGLSN